MSTPARRAAGQVYADASGWTGGTCCEDQQPLPRWIVELPYEGRGLRWEDLRDPVRAKYLAQGMDPDELWCRRCSTFLEDVRDSLEESGPAFLRVIASVAALVPGIGTGVAVALAAAAALAAGESIDQALIDAALAAVPGGFVMQEAFTSGVKLAQGEGIDMVLLDAGRDVIKRVAGPVGAAAYDAVVAVAQGKALQDAGFAVLYAFARGSDLVDKALHFAETMTESVSLGIDVKTLLTRDLISDLSGFSHYDLSTTLGSAVDQIVSEGVALLKETPAELAARLGIPEVLARAAQAAVKMLPDGSLVADQDLLRAIQPPLDLTSAAALILASTSASAALSEAKHEQLLGQLRTPVLLADPSTLAFRLGTLAASASAGDPNAIAAAAAVERGKRILARQPWVAFYNRVNV
jgi:hypothetical protein